MLFTIIIIIVLLAYLNKSEICFYVIYVCFLLCVVACVFLQFVVLSPLSDRQKKIEEYSRHRLRNLSFDKINSEQSKRDQTSTNRGGILYLILFYNPQKRDLDKLK